jgi:hypothetical protein
MAVIQIRNAAGSKDVEREEMPKRDLISKKAMKRIIENKDHQYHDMRRKYEERLIRKTSEVSYTQHNLRMQEKLTYKIGAAAFFIGGLIGGGLTWLMN